MPGWRSRTILVALSLLWLSPPASAEKKPIVAVFDVENRGADLSDELRNRLSDFLAMRIAASGAFQTVPRQQLKERLAAQKKESYKSCYDQTCQIEIGKELAAQKSLTTTVAKLGSRCMVTTVLYDLQRATSEGGASVEGSCSEDGIVESLIKIVAKLAPPSSAPPATPAALPPPADFISVDFETSPAGAEVFLAGRAYGRTPVRANIPRGSYLLALEKRGFQPVREQVTIDAANRRFSRALAYAAEGLELEASRNEWFALLPSVGLCTYGFCSGGLSLEIVTFRWKYLYLTLLELAGGGNPKGGDLRAGPIVGFPLALGNRRQHIFKLGVGLEGFLFTYDKGTTHEGSDSYRDRIEATGFALVPTLSYQYQTTGRFYLGAGFRFLVPVAGDDTYDWKLIDGNTTSGGAYQRQRYPFLFVITLPLGWAELL